MRPTGPARCSPARPCRKTWRNRLAEEHPHHRHRTAAQAGVPYHLLLKLLRRSWLAPRTPSTSGRVVAARMIAFLAYVDTIRSLVPLPEAALFLPRRAGPPPLGRSPPPSPLRERVPIRAPAPDAHTLVLVAGGGGRAGCGSWRGPCCSGGWDDERTPLGHIWHLPLSGARG